MFKKWFCLFFARFCVATTCGYYVWLLRVATTCGYYVWLLRVAVG
jgi:hypothetical protein